MMGFLSPALELMIFLPGMLLVYLPMKHYLRMPPAKLAAETILLTLLLCLTGGVISCFFQISTLWLFFPIAVVMGSFYVHTLRITRWKSVSVFLAVCGAFSCMGSAAIGMSGILSPGISAPPLPFRAVLFWFVMCCFLVAASWHPATHAARNLLEDDAFAQTWYVFWLLPPLFIGLNLAMIPKDPDMLEQGRLRQLYILFSFVFLLLLLLSYVLFYLMAASLNRNDRLRRENQFLSMQRARYDNLRSTIGQIRQARHDMRHHFHVLQSLAAQGNLEGIIKYLDEAQGSIPVEDLGLCKNAAVDSVASYFVPLCRENGIPLTFELDLPHKLPVSEPDLCSVLSNLLENAMEASLKMATEHRLVKVSARLHSGHMVLLSVENTYDGKVKEKDGVFLSSKRPGEGIGLQAVRHIAEKNGGYCRFHFGDGVFCVNVILRGGN
ncbi:MAG: ATP-binding protein [Lachnospiraceae bacterium]|nr:ATP-binding protein [Lachnospiraceae bacterium]